MDSDKSELHRLFEKLDAVAGQSSWIIERTADPVDGKIVRLWSISLRQNEVRGGTLEQAAHAMLQQMLRDAEERVKGREDAARGARDYVDQVRRLIGEVHDG